MTTYMPLDCDGFAAELADYLEGDAPDAVRAAVEAHAAGCAECRRLLEDIGAIRHDAAALPALTPSRDLWAGIAERIDAPVIPLARTRSVVVLRRSWARPALAAAALVVVTAGITHLATRRALSHDSAVVTPPRVASATIAPAPDTTNMSASRAAGTGTGTVERTVVASAASGASSAPREPETRESATSRESSARRESVAPRPASSARLVSGERLMQSTEPLYDREIEKLRHIMRTRRSQLDPKTITVLEQSIAVIDSAIAQSRAALAKDPASGFLATQLNHSLEKKVELLRTAAMLPART